MSGSARNFDPNFLVNLVRGLVYLQVSSEEVPHGELRSQVLVNSNACSRRFPHLQQLKSSIGSCYEGEKEYYNGQRWTPEDDKCTSCNCQVTDWKLSQLAVVMMKFMQVRCFGKNVFKSWNCRLFTLAMLPMFSPHFNFYLLVDSKTFRRCQ